MKFALGLILGLLVASTYFLNQKKSVPENTKKEFQVFTEAEAKRFAEAPDAATKLKAAEELYGRMMILFLAKKACPIVQSTGQIFLA